MYLDNLQRFRSLLLYRIWLLHQEVSVVKSSVKLYAQKI